MIDLDVRASVDFVADHEACLDELRDRVGDLSLCDLGAHGKAGRPDSLGAALEPTLVVGLGDEPVDQEGGRG
ncbi:MAG: hypothetical protein ABSB75_07940, partial [Candidatus Limnocylindrales bacterium]